MPALTQSQQRLTQKIMAARRVVAFTGAGISTESGIPDFRSKDTAWKRYPPMPFGDFIASEANRARAWRGKFAMDDLHAGAKPNRGHFALAGLLQSGKVSTIITQNIDALHVAAGAPAQDVIELHGNATHAVCLACGVRQELSQIRPQFEATGIPPRCVCGGMVKSATISFGQPMPKQAFDRARKAAEDCDLFLVVGSTLVVYPAAALPQLARDRGAELVILNRDPTPLDDRASLILRDDIGFLLEPFLSAAA